MKRILLLIAAVAISITVHAKTDDKMYAHWYEQGMERVEGGRFDTARNCFQIALSYKPDDPDALNALAMAEKRLEEEGTTKTYIETPRYMAEAPLANREVKQQQRLMDYVLRVSGGVSPAIQEAQYSGSDDSVKLSGDPGLQYEIMGICRSRNGEDIGVGGILGVGMFYSSQSGTSEINGAEVAVTNYGLKGKIGLAMRVNRHLVFELTPYVGIGSGKVEIEEYDESTISYLYGSSVGVYIILSRVELGLEGAFGGWESVELSWMGGSTTFSGIGFSASASVGIIF